MHLAALQFHDISVSSQFGLMSVTGSLQWSGTCNPRNSAEPRDEACSGYEQDKGLARHQTETRTGDPGHEKFTAIATAAAIALLTVAPANAQMSGLAVKSPKIQAGHQIVYKTGDKRRNGCVTAGIALGILGAAALAASSHRG